MTEKITGEDFRSMILGAYQLFLREHEHINSLNVFPVPDGDTGTNMLLTLAAVERAIKEDKQSAIGILAKRAADSAIMGARGNSGVILSQIFRGIARGLAGKEEATSSELGKAFQYGILYAYRAVAKPVEGTILTVAKGIAKGAHRAVRGKMSFEDILSAAINAGDAELARTPELLPQLKQAGVVDAGGKGLIVFLRGCMEGLGRQYCGPEANFDQVLVLQEEKHEVDIVHPYCTEFIVKGCVVKLKEARAKLTDLGDSLVVAEGDNALKVHIHTSHPGSVLELAVMWGTLHDIKIDNMADQHRNKLINANEKKGIAVISVAAGDGLIQMMHNLGAEIVIQGGQTMNPPVEAFIEAVHNGSSAKYIILPNNKNIILAAKQAKKLLGDVVEIIPTTDIPQGFAALLAFSADDDIHSNIQQMTARASEVKTGSITVAVRDSNVDGRAVKLGQYLGLADGKLTVAAEDIFTALYKLLKTMVVDDSEIISLYYGKDISKHQAEDIKAKLAESFSEVSIEMYEGGQPNYAFILSVE